MKPEVKKNFHTTLIYKFYIKNHNHLSLRKKKTNKKSQFVKYKHNFNFRKVDNFLQKKNIFFKFIFTFLRRNESFVRKHSIGPTKKRK